MKRERFGRFVLLQEVDSSGLGSDYRAAKLAPGGGLERIVHLLRVAPKLSANAEFVKALLEHAKSASLLHGPAYVRLLAIGRVEAAYYMAYEYVAGRSLRAILERSRFEGFPLAPDHALLIASRVCAALEAAAARKDHGPHAHGLLTPHSVVVTFDGDVKLRGFASWSSGIHKAGGVTAAEVGYLAPEQLKGAPADARSDAFSIGALLFQMLTGEAFRDGAAGEDTARRVRGARMAGGGDSEQLAKPIAEIVTRTAARDPARRYPDLGALRKALDALLFTGGFNPTTFNLAFFMNSLFREEIEREAAQVAEEASAGYTEYAEGSAAPAASSPAPAAAPVPAPKPAAPPSPVAVAPGPEMEVVQARPAPGVVPTPAAREEPRPPAAPRPKELTPAPAPAPVPHRDTVPPLNLRQEPPKGAPIPAIVGTLVALGVAAGGWYFLAGPGAKKPAPPPSTMSAEATAALARVRELEDKLKKFEQEKAEAEAKAAEEAKKKIEAQAAAKGQTVDPAALQRAQEDARRRAQAEQEKKLQEQRQRLEAEKQAEEARLAEERRRAEAAAAAAAATPAPTTLAAAPPPTTLAPAPTPPPTTAAAAPAPAEPATKPGALVNLSDANVLPPVGIKQDRPAYPAIAFQQRAEGRIELSALIDDKGNVAEVKIVKGTTGIGLNQAAVDGVKRWRYRPASRDGVPVKVWIPIVIEFKAPGR
jgi:serine/threonine-protein kinase